MADLRAFQPSFTAGVLSPALWARVDLAKYASGLKAGTNLFVHPHGGASNRAGLEFIREVKNSANNARLIPFQFNTEQSYILEFGDNYMRVFRDGGVILSGAVPYELATPYGHLDLRDLVFVQEADVMYICHSGYAPRKLARLADDNWTLTTVTFAPSIAKPTGLVGTAYFTRRKGSNALVEYKVTALSAGGAESAASAPVSKIVQYSVDDGQYVRLSWNAVSGAALYRVYRSNVDVGILVETTQNSVDVSQLSINGDGTAVPGSSDPGAPAVPTGLTADIVYGRDAKYVVSAISDATGEESLPSSSITLTNEMRFQGNRNTLSWNAVAGASAYIIYRSDNGVYGYIGRSETTIFVDDNIAPDLADTPQDARNPFSGAGKYPRCVTFIEQRLAFAGTNEEPQAIWLSQSANYENFGVSSPAKASDAVTFRIKSRQVNEIRAMLAVRGLMLLTSGSEWIVSGGTNSDAITPSSIKIDNQGYRGAANVQPIIVGNMVLFAQASGGVVRDFGYEFTNDSYTGKDLTIMARHFFENRTIVAWAYAQAPHSMAWTILNDGTMVSLTYMKEHDVWAWTDHVSAAEAVFEDVTVITEGSEDVPYFIVRRKIGGVWKRYIERLHSRMFDTINDAFFPDCGLTYSGAAVDTIIGLDHLAGQEVVALADGNVVRGLTVGAVTGGIGVVLPNAASVVHVGLPVEATLETLDLDLGQVQGLGTVQGRQKAVSNVTLRVERTRGIWIGPPGATQANGQLVEYKQRATEAWNEPIRMYTGDLEITPMWDWNTHGSVVVKQFDPLPMTILAIMPEVTIGR